MKKTIFLITSAINTSTKNSELDNNLQDIQQERFLETLGTINSINATVPHVDIWLADSSVRPYRQEYNSYFPKNTKVISFSDDPEIRSIIEKADDYGNRGSKKYAAKGNPSLDIKNMLRNGYIKSMTESYVTQHIINNMNFEDYQTFIKISGRYCLTPNFDVTNFDVTSKYMLGSLHPSSQPISPIDHEYKTYLWGFCTSIIEDARKTILDTRNILSEHYNKDLIIDLEHAIYEATKEKLPMVQHVEPTDKLGVYGKVDGKIYILR
jgi:hypothetical protein